VTKRSSHKARLRSERTPISDVHALAPRDELAARRADEQSLKAIVSDLWDHGEKLVKAEVELGIELGKAELDRQVEHGKVVLRRTAIMSGFFYAGYLTLLASLVLGLSTVMPAWLAALAVGIVSAVAGYVMLQRDIKEVKEAAHETKQAITKRDRMSNTAAPRAQH